MTIDWLAALNAELAHGNDVVLITVARTQGSAPREAGTSMLVGRATTSLTIGGGHLEWQAIAHARQILSSAIRPAEMHRYSLGARLGQCCGGVVWLLYEIITAKTRPDWLDRQHAIEHGECLQRQLQHGNENSTWTIGSAEGHETTLHGGPEDWHFSQDITAAAFPVYLFGAGHVAQALVRQLLPLGAALTWIDSRDDAFADLGNEFGAGFDQVKTRVTDLPEEEVASAPPGTFFLIMTHSHALDFAVCEAVFRRRDFAYFGLIGSRSKRASFERRLLDRGLPPERLGELTCPIGIPGIVSKQPAVIALAVAAELFLSQNARHGILSSMRVAKAGRPHGKISLIESE